MVDKIQTKVIDADSAPVKGAISNSDYVMIQNDSTKEIEKVLVSDLLAGSAGAIRIKGEAQMDNASTTPTSIVVTGDPDDPTINQGMAPTDPSPNGAAYVVVTNNLNGVSTQITGETRTVFGSDQIVWTGSSWGIVEIGTRVQSVNGRVGNVTGLAEANNVYSKTEADNKFYSDTNKPTPSELGALGATDTAVNSSKLEGSTKAQVIADARSGLALAGTSYSKGESDARYKPIGYAPAWTEITGIPEFATRWPTKSEVGLSNVNNWGASSATNSTSTTTYATTAGVKAAYDAAQAARSAPDLAADRKRKITVSSSAPSGGSDGDIWLQYV